MTEVNSLFFYFFLTIYCEEPRMLSQIKGPTFQICHTIFEGKIRDKLEADMKLVAIKFSKL